MNATALLSAILWVAAVGVLGLYLLRRLSRTGQQRRLARRLKETLWPPDTEGEERG
jgi:hypothetical protein